MVSDETQSLILWGVTLAIFGTFVLLVITERLVRVYSPKSTRFVTVKASTNLSKKLRYVLQAGAEILMPTGLGLYPLLLSNRRRLKWEKKLKIWLTDGVRVTILISTPNDKAIEYWKKLIDLSPNGLRVCVLDRSKASPEDAAEIVKLDTFHPTLVVKDGKPLAMWIESEHPPDSTVAYNVEYVAPNDIIDYQRARFERFLKVLRRLTDENTRPPFLQIYERSAREKTAKAA
jgi:hypothetical protein